MRSVDVLIIVEHKAREFESACLLKVAFEKKGMTVAIDSIFPNKEALPFKYSAKIIVVPWAYNDRDMSYLESFFYKSPNAMIINLHHEQYSGRDEDTACLPVGRAKNVLHVSWGTKFTEALLRCGCDEEDIVTAGNIRLDFYKSNLMRLSVPKRDLARKFQIDEKKRWILFIANGYHLMDDATIERVSRIDSNVLAKKAISDSCREDFLSMVARYLELHSDLVFIYRPHPVFADKDKHSADLNSLCRVYPDTFKVVPDLPIRDWLLASEVCISFHSTSVVECCFANIPYYLFRTKQFPVEFDYAFLSGYEYTITNFDDFKCALSSPSIYDNAAISKRLSSYYSSTDRFTFEQIVSFVLSKSARGKSDAYLRRDLFRVYLKGRIKALIKILSRFSLIRKNMIKSSDARWFRLLGIGEDAFTQKDVADECALLKSALEK